MVDTGNARLMMKMRRMRNIEDRQSDTPGGRYRAGGYGGRGHFELRAVSMCTYIVWTQNANHWDVS